MKNMNLFFLNSNMQIVVKYMHACVPYVCERTGKIDDFEYVTYARAQLVKACTIDHEHFGSCS